MNTHNPGHANTFERYQGFLLLRFAHLFAKKLIEGNFVVPRARGERLIAGKLFHNLLFRPFEFYIDLSDHIIHNLIDLQVSSIDLNHRRIIYENFQKDDIARIWRARIGWRRLDSGPAR